MDLQTMIPAADRAPLPAPVWLFQILLVLTFFLHLLPMNFLVGAGSYLFVSKLRGNGDETARRFSDILRKMLPVTTAATITLGVAPLLFVQVLYGQFFYASSILVGSFWFLVIPLLIFAYYAFYKESFGRAPKWVFGLGVLFVFYVGFMLSYNSQLLMDPSGWKAHHEVGGSGRLAFAGEILGKTFFPRWIHMMTGAFTIAGLWFFVIGMVKAKSDPAVAGFAKRKGAAFFVVGTLVSIVTGFWFLFGLPEGLRDAFLNGSIGGGLPWMVAPVLSLAAAFLLREAAVRGDGWGGRGPAGIALGIVSLVAMVWLRHALRDRALEASVQFRAADLATDPQWGVVAVFLVVFLAGLGVVWAMLRMVLGRNPA